ncbi:uncharacterized protein LOC113401042 [Vanessa tameamea]|uniref:Uncharacterized protein LOC113401042 n=1 Tax=Vanessa tameamea TaxID=334116 RepID=A0ABM4ARE1_VANTA
MESSVQIAESIDTERKIFYKYYVENDFFVSPEGILKVLATVVCTLSSIAFAWGGWCGAGLVAGGTGLVAGGTLAALCALSALLATHAPMTCFITDIILSTVIGVSLLLVTILSFTLCETRRAVDYAFGPLALINSVLVIGSVVMTYMSVSKKWDAETGISTTNCDNPPANELEV